MSRALQTFLDEQSLNDSLLIGFYGGGNYGDELLMEVLAGLLKNRGAKRVAIAYQQPRLYDTFHHDFGFPRVNMHHKFALVKTILAKKRIVVGGGGLWGMDTNLNILLMSLMLWMARWLLGKQVFLLAVGYYDSAPRLGRIGAWFAAKAANCVLARDKESYRNFKRLQPATIEDIDIAWYIDELDLRAYEPDLAQLESQLNITGKTLFITLRRFRNAHEQHLKDLILECLQDNPNKRIIIALMEPRHVDPAGYRQLRAWQRDFPRLQIIDFGGNPLALFLLFRKYHEQLVFIGPQFHGILSAHLTGVPYLPLAYDNKVQNLLTNIAPGATQIRLPALSAFDLQRFIDTTYGEAT